jgi:PAT family beta-lactamase induction signal transducer AmpG
MTNRWIEAATVYRDRRMALILVLGFSSGLPLALSFATLSAWLTQDGIDLTTIGLFALVGLPYTLKFVWSPLVDGISIPWLTRRLGRRRAWMVASQLLLAAAIIALGNTDPGTALGLTAALAFTVAFLSATQDIVIDAFRVEILVEREQGAGAAAVQVGYRFGMLASGAGALMIADAFGWTMAYLVAGLGMGVGLIAVLLAREPQPRAGSGAGDARSGAMSFAAWMQAHVIHPFAEFLARPGWAAVLVFIVLYKLGDAVAGVMSNPFYVQIGFSLTEIGTVTKAFGLLATLTGAVIGGVIVARFGILSALLWCGLLQMLSNLMFAAQALVGADIGFLVLTIGIENLSGGMGTVAFVAYLSRLCSFEFTATQYALFSSLAAVGRTVLSSGGGWLVVQLDWFWFFVASTICALPGLLVLLWMMRGRAGFIGEESEHADRVAQGDQDP